MVSYADTAYRAACPQEEAFAWSSFRLHVICQSAGAAELVKLLQRWAAERTFARLGRSRWLKKDRERLPESGAATIQVSMIHLVLRGLAPVQAKRSDRFGRTA